MNKKFIVFICIGVALVMLNVSLLSVFVYENKKDSRYLPQYLMGDSTANPDYDAKRVQPTSNERGLVSLKIWEDKERAFRTCLKAEAADHWRVLFAEDNTMMLWAMSKGLYKWSHQQAYPTAIRDFLLTCLKNEYSGVFYMGKFSGENDSSFAYTFDKPEGLDFVFLDPYVPFMPLFGVVAYTIAYPLQDGEFPAAYYTNYIPMIIQKQQEIIDLGRQTKYLSTSSLAFHMATSANWYAYTGEKQFLDYAKSTYSLIEKRIQRGDIIMETDGGVVNPLRHIQTVWAMFETLRAVGDFANLRTTMTACRNAMKLSETYDAGIYLVEDYRSSERDDEYCTKLQIAYGYFYLSFEDKDDPIASKAYNTIIDNRQSVVDSSGLEGFAFNTWVNESDPDYVGTGTIEANSMAWLADWWYEVLNKN